MFDACMALLMNFRALKCFTFLFHQKKFTIEIHNLLAPLNTVSERTTGAEHIYRMLVVYRSKQESAQNRSLMQS